MLGFNDFLAQLEGEYNGCPWFDENSEELRERHDLDELVGTEVIIEDCYPIKDYHAVIFRGNPYVYFTGGALKNMLNKYAAEYMRYLRNIVLRIGEKKQFRDEQTGDPKEYRPVYIVGKVQKGADE